MSYHNAGMNHRALVIVLAAVAFAGCNKKEGGQAAPGVGQGSDRGSATPAAPPRPRASALPLPRLPALTLADDPRRADKIALGHALFFDQRLSGGNDRACYSCHQNEDGNGGHDPMAIGSGDKQLTRHAPVIWNAGYWSHAFAWDGRPKSLEDGTKGGWGAGNMNAAPGADTPEKVAAALDKKAAEIAAIPGYKKLFEAAFPGTAIKADHVTGALGEYMRTLVCNDTAYDKYAGGDKAALTETQQRGLDLFQGKARCAACHAPPFFSTAMGVEGGAYFNVGIGTEGPEDKVDVGRMKVSNKPEDWAAFKPPSLRNVTKSPPYFHNGSVAKLADAVKLMASGGIANRNKSPLLEDTQLTDAESSDLIAFLGALDCPGTLEHPTLP